MPANIEFYIETILCFKIFIKISYRIQEYSFELDSRSLHQCEGIYILIITNFVCKLMNSKWKRQSKHLWLSLESGWKAFTLHIEKVIYTWEKVIVNRAAVQIICAEPMESGSFSRCTQVRYGAKYYVYLADNVSTQCISTPFFHTFHFKHRKVEASRLRLPTLHKTSVWLKNSQHYIIVRRYSQFTYLSLLYVNKWTNRGRTQLDDEQKFTQKLSVIIQTILILL